MTTRAFMSAFSQFTGRSLKYVPFAFDSDVFLFLKVFDLGDMALVVKHVRKRYGENKEIMERMLAWKYLVRQRDKFAELLSEAKVQAAKVPSERARVLSMTGRTEAQEKKAQAIGDVLRKMTREDLLKGLAQLRESI